MQYPKPYQNIVSAISVRLISLIISVVVMIVINSDAQASATNGKIAFTTNRDGNREIYVMNPDGTNPIRLTNTPGLDDYPAWSPDGRRLAYLSQTASGGHSIKLMNPDGTGQTEITTVMYSENTYLSNWIPRWRMSWSPDGTRIAFCDGHDIYAINVDGTNRVNLSNHPAFDSHPSWSPDGSRIVFSSIRAANEASFRWFTVNPDGSDPIQLPGGLNEAYISDIDPVWSPDGTRLAGAMVWVLDVGTLVVRDVFGGLSFIDFVPDRDTSTPTWSPDATKIAFGAYVPPWGPNPNSEIFVVKADGTGITNLTNTVFVEAHPAWQSATRTTAISDFDGDARSDVSVFRPSDGVWHLNRSTQGYAVSRFGISTDKLVPADYDGDGKTDVAVYRDGTWWRINSGDLTVSVVQFGLAGDVPLPADYTGDGRDELAVYRDGQWWQLDLSNGNVNVAHFGLATDKPVPADYDGDSRVDEAVYRNGEWHLNRSSQGYAVAQFGLVSDRPLTGDHDGDGKADLAVYRDGMWYLLQSREGFGAFPFGIASDIPVPADYDGDGKTDAAVYRDGVWYVLKSTGGVSIQQFGLAGDMPVPAAFS